MASSATGITSISAEFSVGSSTSKTMISMATSSAGISMVTRSSITHQGQKNPQYSLRTLGRVDPLERPLCAFIRNVLSDSTTKCFKLYCYSLFHPATLAYTVVLGGLLFHYGISKAFALACPPVLAFYIVKARLQHFSEEALSQDLVQPCRYYHERKRTFFLAVEEEDEPNEEDCDSFKPPALGSILGCIAVDTEQAGSTAVIRHLCVHAQYRRQGIGQQLLAKALSFCDKERFSRIELCTNNLQGPAAKLCLKNNFKKVTESTEITILPGVEITRNKFVRCLRLRHTSSCCY